MKYFIVTYFKRPNGQMDETVSVSKNIKNRDIQTASVILDFKEGKVIKASLGSNSVPRDFIKIRDFYRQYYSKLMEDLEAVYGHYEIFTESDTSEVTPDTEQATS